VVEGEVQGGGAVWVGGEVRAVGGAAEPSDVAEEYVGLAVVDGGGPVLGHRGVGRDSSSWSRAPGEGFTVVVGGGHQVELAGAEMVGTEEAERERDRAGVNGG